MKTESEDTILNSAEPWNPPPAALTLEDDCVHVWRASLGPSAPRAEALQQTLSATEKERAGRFVFHADRDRFVVTRGLLRTILGLYLGERPGELRFGRNQYGKPFLSRRPGEMAINFNVSRSRELALFAVARNRQVGVDLEYIRPGWSEEAIPEHFFAPSEVSALRALPAALQREAFFHCWTHKEAYVKAVGGGLSQPLNQFAVSAFHGESGELLTFAECPGEMARWSLRVLPAGAAFAAALAVKGRDYPLTYLQWQWPD